MEIPAGCTALLASRVIQGRCVFARLTQVAARRDRDSGCYREPLAESLFGETHVHRALRLLHLEAFRNWIGLTLAEQVEDLDQFLPAEAESRRAVLRNTTRFSRYEELIPPDAVLPERLLFVCDLDVDLDVLRARLDQPAVRPRARRKPELLVAWRMQLSS